MENKLIYYPAVSAKYTKFLFINNEAEDIKKICRQFLLSTSENIEFVNLRKDMGLNSFEVFADNGGFNLKKDEINYKTILQKINWQLNNGDIIPVFDVPYTLTNDINESIKQQNQFKNLYLDLPEDKKIFEVIHTDGKVETYINYLEKIYDENKKCSGLALGSFNLISLTKKKLESLFFFIEMIDKFKLFDQIHIFGLNNLSIINLLKKITTDLNLKISYDTGTPFILAEQRKIITDQLELADCNNKTYLEMAMDNLKYYCI